jgi:hypothetical protein
VILLVSRAGLTTTTAAAVRLFAVQIQDVLHVAPHIQASLATLHMTNCYRANTKTCISHSAKRRLGYQRSVASGHHRIIALCAINERSASSGPLVQGDTKCVPAVGAWQGIELVEDQPPKAGASYITDGQLEKEKNTVGSTTLSPTVKSSKSARLPHWTRPITSHKVRHIALHTKHASDFANCL